jgi:hypothetical protein
MFLDAKLQSAVPLSTFARTGPKRLAGELSSVGHKAGTPLPDFIYVAHEARTLVLTLWGVYRDAEGTLERAEYESLSGWKLTLFND